jgi:dihydropteroate synthase
MHNRGNSAGSQYNQATTGFNDVVADVISELLVAAQKALTTGIPTVIVDPGVGFGKSLNQNLHLIVGGSKIVAAFQSVSYEKNGGSTTTCCPVLYGISRKSVIGALSGRTRPEDRDPASALVAQILKNQGVHLLRTHNPQIGNVFEPVTRSK